MFAVILYGLQVYVIEHFIISPSFFKENVLKYFHKIIVVHNQCQDNNQIS